MKNIDFIYLINLDERPEKLEKTLQELEPFALYPYRFAAVNGWKLPLETINALGVKYAPWMQQGLLGTSYLHDDGEEIVHEMIATIGRNYFCQTMARGAIGCSLSHLSILYDAYVSGYETIWVMEDDIHVVQSPLLLSALIEELDALAGSDGWDILYTDPATKGQDGRRVECSTYHPRPNFSPKNPSRFSKRKKCGSCFWRVGARYGTYSMIIRRSGMKKILDFFHAYQMFMPYDMEICLPDDIHLFTVEEDIVSTYPVAGSDNRIPGYLID